MVTCKLQKPVRSKLLNHKKFVEYSSFHPFVQNKTTPFRHRENSAFIDLYHDHLLTGDLIIEYVAKLRKLIKCIWDKWSCRTGF